jgi:endonuclease YncB( thermonuclease family)
VREGYAQPFTKSPNVRYAALFRRCGQEARDAGRGLWRQP